MTRATLIAALFMVFAGAVASDGFARTWTDRKGRTVEADFVALEEGVVRIRRARDNQIFAIPLEQLSDADQAFARGQGSRPAGPGVKLPCTLKLAEFTVAEGTGRAALDFAWSPEAPALAKEELTVVVLFQPKLISPLTAELMAIRRNYSFSLPNDHLMRMTSGLVITEGAGPAHDGALMLFFAGADSQVDFRTSARYEIPLRIQPANRLTGEPAVMGKGVLSIGLFKEDDPTHDQLKSIRYRPLSNVVSHEVDLK